VCKIGRMNPVAILAVLAALFALGCDGCRPRGPRHEMDMCGKCVFSSECRVGLECVAGTCETVPTSCHVKIGL
jgi:hypothetical protein